jgi:hypothetical protein
VIAAIVTLEERGSSSTHAIKKAIAATGATSNTKVMNTALKSIRKREGSTSLNFY